MGYTHYYTFKVPKGIKAATLESAYQTALQECARVAHAYNAECDDNGLTDARLSGYTAHTKVGQYGGLQLNGKGELGHESFELREHFKQNIESDNGFGFVKTARKPYDSVIVACLAILKYRLGNAIDVSSDGTAGDWVNGVLLARRVIKRKVPNPLSTRELAKPDKNTPSQTFAFKVRAKR